MSAQAYIYHTSYRIHSCTSTGHLIVIDSDVSSFAKTEWRNDSHFLAQYRFPEKPSIFIQDAMRGGDNGNYRWTRRVGHFVIHFNDYFFTRQISSQWSFKLPMFDSSRSLGAREYGSVPLCINESMYIVKQQTTHSWISWRLKTFHCLCTCQCESYGGTLQANSRNSDKTKCFSFRIPTLP